jgi:hypothetical protein
MPGTLLVRPRNGLCNRLRVLSSFAALARRCHRELRVCWAPSPGWSDEQLEDLFENRFAHVTEAEFDQLSADALCLHDAVTVAGVGGANETWTYAGNGGLAAVFDSAAPPLVSYRGFRPAHELLAPEDRRRVLPGFNREFQAELRAWRPVPAIRERVDELAGTFDGDTVGVHIRRGDAAVHPRLRDQYRRSTDAAFIRRMDRIVRSRPDTSFFLATDTEETQRRFQERYGSRILTNTEKRFVPSIPDAPKANQHDAVVDLFALARTQTILGSHYSTFSLTAATLGGARLKVALEDSWLVQLRRKAAYARHELARRTRARARRSVAAG